MILDIHTHRLDPTEKESIQNVEIDRFAPQDGCFYSLGIHPWKVGEHWEDDFKKLQQYSHHPSVLAIGEAGLDRFVTDNINLQKIVFEQQISWCEEIGKPLIIHCVKCFNELIALKRQYRPNVPWIVHGFRNNPFIAERLLNEDFYLSIGERYQATVVEMIPDDRLLTETDESTKNIHSIIESLATIKRIPAEELIGQLHRNTQKVFFKA